MDVSSSADEKHIWVKPEGTATAKLKLYNSLTKKKVCGWWLRECNVQGLGTV